MNNNPLAFTNFLEIVTNTSFLIGIVVFVTISYLLIALLTWSLTKPLKYLSIPFIIIGILILIIRFCLPLIFTLIPQNELSIPSTIIGSLLSPFLKSGIICLFIGIISMASYILIGKLKKNKTVVEEEKKLINE